MNNREIKKVFIRVSIFTVISLALMFHRAATKHIMITDAAGVQIDRQSSEDSYNLLIDRDVADAQRGKLIIPLPKSVNRDNIVLEDHYIDYKLLIYVEAKESGFYLDNPVKTDVNILKSAVCRNEDETGSVCLEFGLDGLYANESTLTDTNTIEVKFMAPQDKYDKIVLIDPLPSDSNTGVTTEEYQPKDLALAVSTELISIADKKEGNDIKFYFTRLQDKSVDNTRKEELIKETGADLLIGIGALSSDSSQDNGVLTTYNGDYYLRKLTNADLAGIMEKNCLSKASTDAAGVRELMEDDELLANSKIPSARIYVGYTTGERDSERFKDSGYFNKIAEGIYQGASEAFEVMR